MTCEHKRLKHGYEKTYDVTWCLDCGVITHSSDGLIGPGLHKRTDWSDWINVNLEAWSCRNEAHDGKRCSHWCGGSTCPASIRSVATRTQNDSMQPAHRALLRQYESITELESRLAAAKERIAKLEADLAAAQAERDEAFKKGVKAFFDYLYIRAANNYHYNAEKDAEREKYNEVVRDWADDALHDLSPDYHVEWLNLSATVRERDEARAEAAALRVDAERYRWLRDVAAYVGVNPYERRCLWTLRGVYEIDDNNFDAAIDQARGAAHE